MGMNESRRNLFLIAGSTLLTSLLTRTAFAKGGPVSDKASVDEFLRTSQLSPQIDLLMESVIKKNPHHVKLTAEQMDSLMAEGRLMLKELYVRLANEEFTQQDLAEMIHHFSLPAEQKWAKFNKLAVGEAKTLLTDKIHGIVNNKKSV